MITIGIEIEGSYFTNVELLINDEELKDVRRVATEVRNKNNDRVHKI